jgi:hypothetical protein
MDRYLVKLQRLQMAVNQDAAFVSFVSPPSMLKSRDGPRKEDTFVTECFVSAQSGQLEDIKSATETDRQNRQNPSGTSEQLGPGTLTGHFDGALAALRFTCAELVEAERWLQAISDAEAFLAVWGAQACALGWNAEELFGLHPVPTLPAPSFQRLSRYDAMGLVWLLHSRPVITLTATEAVIRATSGATVTYRRRQPAGIAKGTAA